MDKIMAFEEFVKLVGEMREKQIKYFATRSHDVLIESKQIEKRVDDALKLITGVVVNVQ